MAHRPDSVTVLPETDPLDPLWPQPHVITAQCREAYPHLAAYSRLQERAPLCAAPWPDPEEPEELE